MPHIVKRSEYYLPFFSFFAARFSFSDFAGFFLDSFFVSCDFAMSLLLSGKYTWIIWQYAQKSATFYVNISMIRCIHYEWHIFRALLVNFN